MAWIWEFLKRTFLPRREDEEKHDGDGVGTDKRADVLETDTEAEVCFSGPIHSTEPEDECKHPDTGEGAEAEALKEGFDAPEATEEVHNTNQEQSESPDRFPNISPLNSPKRGMKRTGTLVPDSDVQQATKKSKRAPNWNRVETQKLINICSLQTSHAKRNMDWEAASNQIPGRTAKQCRQRYDTLLKSYKKIRTFCLDKCKVFEQVTEEEFRSMKLDRNFLENDHWYETIDRCHSPPLQSSRPPSHNLNGASASTLSVGKTNLPSAACPNPEVSHPELATAAFPCGATGSCS